MKFISQFFDFNSNLHKILNLQQFASNQKIGNKIPAQMDQNSAAACYLSCMAWPTASLAHTHGSPWLCGPPCMAAHGQQHRRSAHGARVALAAWRCGATSRRCWMARAAPVVTTPTHKWKAMGSHWCSSRGRRQGRLRAAKSLTVATVRHRSMASVARWLRRSDPRVDSETQQRLAASRQQSGSARLQQPWGGDAHH
jgi:hypothetical protein